MLVFLRAASKSVLSPRIDFPELCKGGATARTNAQLFPPGSFILEEPPMIAILSVVFEKKIEAKSKERTKTD
jgi:hypothetical protein